MAVGMFGNPRGLFANPTTQPLGSQYGQDPMQPAPGAIPNGVPMAPVSAAADPMKLTLLDKLGMAGGIISRNYGGQDGVTDTIQQRMQQAYAQRQYQQHLQDSQAQWLGQQEWERAHPKPVEPTEFERSVQAAGIQPGTAEYQSIMRNYAVNRSDPTQIVANGDGSFTPYTRSQVRGGGSTSAPSGPPDAAVSYLKQNPHFAAQFDQKYGAGASQRYLQGGAAPSGTATFR